MKIAIDLQGGQTSASRNRGTGRYSLSLTKAILKNKKEHEIVIVLSSLFLETIELVKVDLKNYIDEKNIHVWNAPNDVCHMVIENNTRRKNAEFIRETFLASLKPDIILVTSLFEGLVDDAVTSIGEMEYSIPTAVVLYDLIPFINQTPYLDNPVVKLWYEEKLEYLKRADLLLSISESSRQESLEYLNSNPSSVINIGTSSDKQFQKIDLSKEEKKDVLDRYLLTKDFLMYTGGIDHRKNIEGLIRSYALLNVSIRDNYQLAIVCSINDAQRKILYTLVKEVGLTNNEVIFTGYIPEEDLISLYNTCRAFIFPSWHEGFGLPALEAMNCGVPVIASDRSSLPEVIGIEDALFDSLNDDIMSEKIEQVLTDEVFREKLLNHQKEQIKKFSWEKSAKKTIRAFENFMEKKEKKIIKSTSKLKLAYISPLPPQRSGISDYSLELLPQLAKYYDIEIISEIDDISNKWINENCTIHSIEYFKENSTGYNRILYHFGNSHFHQYMFNLLNEYPGIVVLHDFYLSGVINYMSVYQYQNFSTIEELYYSHGYKPFMDKNIDNVWAFPSNKRVLDHAKGIIVHSENSKRLADKWYGDDFSDDWNVIPLLRVPSTMLKKETILKKLKLPMNAFIVCSFGLLGQTKQNQKLLDAWMNSNLSKDKNSYLIFVGENDSGEYGASLVKTIKQNSKTSQVKITGWTQTDEFKEYLSIANIGVQLRTMSRGETSAAVLDCMNYGISTIINANGSMADINDEVVYKLEDEFTQQELICALEELYTNNNKRDILGQKAKDVILKEHDPEKCAKEYFETIETFYDKVDNEKDGLIDKIVKNNINIDDKELKNLADAISKNHLYTGEKQLFIDVSQLLTIDSKSGIQRVVKSILRELLLNPPKGYRVEPVYATTDMLGYKYAKNFTFKFLSYECTNSEENLLDFKNGDIFLGLDLDQHVVISQKEYYKILQVNGVKTYFVIYDLLPILKSEYFPGGYLVKDLHSDWLEVVTKNDGAICISKSVKNELNNWIEINNIEKSKLFKNSCFHLGSEILNEILSRGFPENYKIILKDIKSKVTFLMVGTLEPRKGHRQTLKAFEILWENGVDINLVIIGKQGWLMEDFVETLRTHPELEKRLFWLEGISDEYLQKVYESSDCLIAASEGEGFGLPLIEAARYKMPIIARDIPVFREVAGEFAYYFKDDHKSEVLEDAIKGWLELYKNGKHIKSDDMPWLTWEESAHQLISRLEVQNKCN